MDIALHLRVIWRFRVLLLIGVVIGALVATLSVAKVEFGNGIPTLESREQKVYASSGRLLVSQSGFPLGRSTLSDLLPGPTPIPRFSPPARFTELAALYAELATSDPVLRRTGGRVSGLQVFPSTQFPIITFTATGLSPVQAQRNVQLAMAALSEYIAEQQRRNRIEAQNRVLLNVIVQPRGAFLVTKVSRVRPLAIFMLIVGGTLLGVFLLENLRPRPAMAAVQPEPPLSQRVDRLSA
jgi:hypothetical protein